MPFVSNGKVYSASRRYILLQNRKCSRMYVSGITTEDCKTRTMELYSTRVESKDEDGSSNFAPPCRSVDAAEYLSAHLKFVGLWSLENQNLVDSAVGKRRVGGSAIIKRDGNSGGADDDRLPKCLVGGIKARK